MGILQEGPINFLRFLGLRIRELRKNFRVYTFGSSACSLVVLFPRALGEAKRALNLSFLMQLQMQEAKGCTTMVTVKTRKSMIKVGDLGGRNFLKWSRSRAIGFVNVLLIQRVSSASMHQLFGDLSYTPLFYTLVDFVAHSHTLLGGIFII